MNTLKRLTTNHRTTSTAPCFLAPSADVPEGRGAAARPTVTGCDGRTWSYDPAQVLAATKAHTAGADLPFDYVNATEPKSPQGEDATGHRLGA
ncbi:hypothetical protein [Ectopseudomonas oleovorans]|uniref:hypothetical protein n=1 Tax=Ectopseudomonas oleovorans TaxID=301 RepID=UPI003F1CA8D1